MNEMGRRFLPLPCVAIMLCGAACKVFQSREAMVKVISHKNDAQLVVRRDGDLAIIEIFSESGIGEAAFEVIPDSLPQKILLHFHLRGLEELRFGYGEIVITASIASTGERGIRQSMHRAGEEPVHALTPSSPFWMKIRVASRNPISLNERFIAVEAPEDFLAGGARHATIHWIDFYR